MGQRLVMHYGPDRALFSAIKSSGPGRTQSAPTIPLDNLSLSDSSSSPYTAYPSMNLAQYLKGEIAWQV